MINFIDSDEYNDDDTYYRYGPPSPPPSPPRHYRKKSQRRSLKRKSTRRKRDSTASSHSHRHTYERHEIIESVPELISTCPVKYEPVLAVEHRSEISHATTSDYDCGGSGLKGSRRKDLWNEVKNLKETCSTRMELITVVSLAIFKDVGYLLLTIIISLFTIVIGFMYVTECPQCTFIPIYLILIGIFGIVNQIASYRIHRKTTDILEDHSKDSIILRLTFILLFVTFGLGSYWIFKLFQPNYDRNLDAEEYCNKFVYLFAFAVTISIYIVSFGVPLVRFILAGIKRMLLKKKKNDAAENVEIQNPTVINIV